jgi:putative hydrolase of the HAD superfamily
MSDPHTVWFDLDDTLYPYARYARAGLAAAADHIEAETGQGYHDELLEIYFRDGITQGTFDELVDRHDLPGGVVDDAIEAFHSSTTPLEPYADTEAVLDALREEYRLGVITDGRGGHAKLERLGLADRFETVVVTDELDRSKADPRVFEHAFDKLSTAPWSAVYIGDDPRIDFRLPNAFGMSTVRLRRGRYTDLEPAGERFEPDTEIATLDELPAVLPEMGSSEQSAATVEREQ